MASLLTNLRRTATDFAIRRAVGVSARLQVAQQCQLARSLAAVPEAIPMLRARVRENVRLALGSDISADAARRYFRHIGWMQGAALATFHHGLAESPVVQDASFDDSCRLVDEAVAEGRGALIVSPHWSGHELLAALVAQRHPMTMLVRRSSATDRMSRKLKWYSALGVEVILRPEGASTIRDAAAYMSVLRKGRVLAITPDLLSSSEAAIEVEVFGRRAKVLGGSFAIACAAHAPMLRPTLRWKSDKRVVVHCTRADPPIGLADRSAAIRTAAQDWFNWFEDSLQVEPENWLFWLDKRWSRFLRAEPRRPRIP
jgi:lauroyl/myristoyl acyltransferase